MKHSVGSLPSLLGAPSWSHGLRLFVGSWRLQFGGGEREATWREVARKRKVAVLNIYRREDDVIGMYKGRDRAVCVKSLDYEGVNCVVFVLP